jgi:hypothetical protein
VWALPEVINLLKEMGLMRIVERTVLTMFGLFTVCVIFSAVRAYWRDGRKLHCVTFASVMDRHEIQGAFLSFATPWARERYVSGLKDHGVRAVGEWDGGAAPNLRDFASTLLAQMEERWLGLDR